MNDLEFIINNYVEAYSKSADNLAGILDDWSTFDDDMQCFYEMELLCSVWVPREEMVKLGKELWIDVNALLTQSDAKFLAQADRIRSILGIEITDFIKRNANG